MKKEILIAIGITILFLGTCITSSVAVDNVKKPTNSLRSGNTLYVGGTGETFCQFLINVWQNFILGQGL